MSLASNLIFGFLIGSSFYNISAYYLLLFNYGSVTTPLMQTLYKTIFSEATKLCLLGNVHWMHIATTV